MIAPVDTRNCGNIVFAINRIHVSAYAPVTAEFVINLESKLLALRGWAKDSA
jgi:hypothetical protein